MELDRGTAWGAVHSLSLLLTTCLFSGCAEELPQLPATNDPAKESGAADLDNPNSGSNSGNPDSVELTRHTFITIGLLAGSDARALDTQPQNNNAAAVTNDLVNIAKSADTSGGLGIEAVWETVTDCPGGGTVTYTRDDQGEPWFSTGDSFTTTFDQCVNGTPPNERTTDGSRSFRVDELIGQPWVTTPWVLTTSMTRTNFSVTTATGNRVVDGVSSIEFGSEDGVVYRQVTTGNSATSRTADGTETSASRDYRIAYFWDQSLNAYTLEFDIATQSSLFDDVTASTLTPLSGTIGQPPSGGSAEIVRTDSTGNTSTITVEALPGGLASVSQDTDGDGIVDSTREIPWTQIGIEAYLYQQRF